MVTGFHLLTVWQYIGECHFQGYQGYALHLAAVQASLTSQAPPPMLTSVDEFNLSNGPCKRKVGERQKQLKGANFNH